MSSKKKEEINNGESGNGMEETEEEKESADEKTRKSGLEKTENFEEKFNELNNRFLRLAADFDNYKKRSAKERQQARLEGLVELASSFFGTMDNLELALRHGNQASSDDIESFIQGVRLTYEQSVSQLKNLGIMQISAKTGEKFNPEIHQAIENRPSEEVVRGSIVQEIKKGYSMGTILIRPVFVAVSSGVESRAVKDKETEK